VDDVAKWSAQPLTPHATANSPKPTKGEPPPGRACVRPPDSLANRPNTPHAVITGRKKRRLCGDATCPGITRPRRR
jgi:hypothetical protein